MTSSGDETSFPREVAEAALAHKVGNEVEHAYRRSSALEKRRKLMVAWANHCLPEAENTTDFLCLGATVVFRLADPTGRIVQ